jgi:serine/threonine protein kinase
MEQLYRQSFDPLIRNVYFNKYKPIKKIGEGSFGLIYMAENILSEEVYALKFEDRHSGQNLLESEAFVMGYLKGGINILTSSWNT